MTIDLSGVGAWVWIAVAIVIAFVVFRYFFHIVVRIIHFAISFFWHGCATAIVLLVLYFILRAFHIL